MVLQNSEGQSLFSLLTNEYTFYVIRLFLLY